MTNPFNINPNRRRKVYLANSISPKLESVVINDVTRSVDRNHYYINRDFYVFQPFLFASGAAPAPPPVETAEYEENTITFGSDTSGLITFLTAFSSTPVVTVVTEGSTGTENVVAYLTSISQTNAVVRFSAPYGGTIRYRAANLSPQPQVVERLPSQPGLFYTISAGQVAVDNDSSFTATYPSLGATPTDLFLTPYDDNANSDVDVAVVQTGSLGTTSTRRSSSPITSTS